MEPGILRTRESIPDGGGQGQNRTADTRIFSPLLYRLSYLAPGAGLNETAAAGVKTD